MLVKRRKKLEQNRRSKLKESQHSAGSSRSVESEVRELTCDETYACFAFYRQIKLDDIEQLRRNVPPHQMAPELQLLEIRWRDMLYLQFGIE